MCDSKEIVKENSQKNSPINISSPKSCKHNNAVLLEAINRDWNNKVYSKYLRRKLALCYALYSFLKIRFIRFGLFNNWKSRSTETKTLSSKVQSAIS